MEQALFLARIASRVTVVHRKNGFRASKAMATALKHPKILILWHGHHALPRRRRDGRPRLRRPRHGLRRRPALETSLSVDGVFVSIGMNPNTDLFTTIRKDEDGYITPSRAPPPPSRASTPPATSRTPFPPGDHLRRHRRHGHGRRAVALRASG